MLVDMWFANNDLFLKIAFVVSKLEEGAKIYQKPYFSKGEIVTNVIYNFNRVNPSIFTEPSVVIHLRINLFKPLD